MLGAPRGASGHELKPPARTEVMYRLPNDNGASSPARRPMPAPDVHPPPVEPMAVLKSNVAGREIRRFNHGLVAIEGQGRGRLSAIWTWRVSHPLRIEPLHPSCRAARQSLRLGLRSRRSHAVAWPRRIALRRNVAHETRFAITAR